ncbi:MAG: MBL fold metallo-hydrolase [Chloroflexota bacterium]|nr:MBL fold metallo-hydrolase [Chloroflexota bacterium]
MGRGLVPDARSIRRVDFGYFVRPPEETGTGQARVESCLGYVVAHPEDGFLLFDTGMGSTPDVDRHYRPTRRPLAEALRPLGVTVHDVRLVVNCHLHFDHCGGNPELADRPVFVQAAELESAQLTPDYTLPELIDFPGARYEKLNGEAEIAPGLLAVPTPGHTDGHQSLVIRCEDGTVVLAGQSHDTSTAFSADQLARRARDEGADQPLPTFPPWMERILELDPARVLFAHDQAVWEPA